MTNIMDELESNWNEITSNFDDLNLKDDLIRGIVVNGIEKPTIIQQKLIKPIILRRDVFTQVGSDTRIGKTTALGISILQNIDTLFNEPQVL